MPNYPFSAVLGCDATTDAGLDDMGLALILTTIAPDIGGVLIRGEKGTAKSTAVRALAAVLPPIDVYADDRFSIDPSVSGQSPDGDLTGTAVTQRPVRLVELPVGATEDRVLGSLHLQSALAAGKVEYEPGLLARAHRGVLYVDEVNLLHDHLVDLLLDAAAMGQSTVERDGVSIEHPARFVLIGTMNPEEGELRPQLLDRFGLTVEIAAPRDPAQRAEVVRRRMAFDSDPGQFIAQYVDAERQVTERIETARRQIDSIELSEAMLLTIARVCAGFDVDGLRADIVTARTAIAHAAWQGRNQVTKADIRTAALLSLPHRRRRNPFDAPGLDEDLLDELLNDDSPEPEPEPDPDPDPGRPETTTDESVTGQSATEESAPEESVPGEAVAGEAVAGESVADESTAENAPDANPSPPQPSSESETVVAAQTPFRPKFFAVRGVGAGSSGKRSRALSNTGRRVGAVPATTGGSLHLVETIKAAASRRASQGDTAALRGDDLRVAVREGREANLLLFCVDASGSMAARKRMIQVKTAILSLLMDAYRRRDKVGLVTFRGAGAELVLPPTSSTEIAASRLDELPAGGRTPIAEGLLEAGRVLERERRRDRTLRPLLVVVTDGRATGGSDAVLRSRQAADYVASLSVTTVVIDGESGRMRLGLARVLAEHLRAEHIAVDEVSAETLTMAGAA